MKVPYIPFMDACNYSYEQLSCFSQNSIYPNFIVLNRNCYIAPSDSFHNATSCAALSVDNINGQHRDITIYPNPANEQISVSLDGGFDDNTTITVYDLMSREIGHIPADKKMNRVTINTSTWNSGCYMMIIQNNTGIIKKEKVMVIK
jgi:hypothetical protein